MSANPVVPGFNPDPSIVLVDGTYFLVTSTFEYLPGIPVYRSTDLVEWEQVGNVVTRPEQAELEKVLTGGGVWAPTIRHRDGVFFVVVTIAMSPRGCVVFTATDPAGPWSDGVTLEAVGGIDPDLAWDDDGTAHVTFSGLFTSVEQPEGHHGIQQVRVDLATGAALEEPRSLWSGSGLMFPEAPHLHRRGDDWYLVIAEGGTERGHSVSVARGPSPRGPFTGCPANPVLSARSTDRPVQNTGHADLVETPDGGWAAVLLGVRPLGLTRSFSPLGRETFLTPVEWVDGWPIPAPVSGAPRPGAEVVDVDFADPGALDDPAWIAVRRLPGDVGSLTEVPGRLTITGDGIGLRSPAPAFLGRRQRHHTTVVRTTVDASRGAGGLAARYDEDHHVSLEARGHGARTQVIARACVAGLERTWETVLDGAQVQLRLETCPPPPGFTPEAKGGDRIRLAAGGDDGEVLLTELDGRYWTSETCASFTGRVVGLFAIDGTVGFTDLRYRGTDLPEEQTR